jgi:hypothetical protein
MREADYEKHMKNKDIVNIWKLIKTTHSGKGPSLGRGFIPGEIDRELLENLESITMGDNENLSTYVKRFNNALKAYEGTTVKVPEVPLQVALFLRNLCDTRFRQFKVNLRSDFHQLNVAYPTTINAAFTRAADWKMTIPFHTAPQNLPTNPLHHFTHQLPNLMTTLQRVVDEREVYVAVKVDEDVGEDVIIPLSLPKVNAMSVTSVEPSTTTPIIVLAYQTRRQPSATVKASILVSKHMTSTVHPRTTSSLTLNALITYSETLTFFTISTHHQPLLQCTARWRMHHSPPTKLVTLWILKKKSITLMKPEQTSYHSPKYGINLISSQTHKRRPSL